MRSSNYSGYVSQGDSPYMGTYMYLPKRLFCTVRALCYYLGRINIIDAWLLCSNEYPAHLTSQMCSPENWEQWQHLWRFTSTTILRKVWKLPVGIWTTNLLISGSTSNFSSIAIYSGSDNRQWLWSALNLFNLYVLVWNPSIFDPLALSTF